jgi:hypothetical protein
MATKIVIELEIEGDAQRAYDTVKGLLDAGEYDWAGGLEVLSATVQVVAIDVRELVRSSTATKFYAHSNGDRSVGIGPSDATIEIEGLDDDPGLVQATRESLQDAFKQIFDDARVSVLTETEMAQLTREDEEEA